MDEEVIPILRVSDAAAAAARYQRLGFGDAVVSAIWLGRARRAR